MTEKMIKAVFDCASGETEYIELSDKEIADLLKQQEEAAKSTIAREAEMARIDGIKQSAKAKLVAGEPLTEEEAATIVF
jgi:hypothetical protein